MSADFSSEKALEGVEEILVSLERGYGLNRDQAISCLYRMAICLEDFRPGDPGLEARFHNAVEDGVNNFETWAERVDRAITSWGEGK